MKLYWASTEDGYEDWFIVAPNENEAAREHELREGYNRGVAKAEYICNIPDNLIDKYGLNDPDWVSHELLLDLGAKIFSYKTPRRVNYRGKLFVEGDFVEKMMFEQLEDKKGVYIIKEQNSNRYKFGKTTNLEQRIKTHKVSNPNNLKLVYFIATEDYHKLETVLKKGFSDMKIDGEWFILDDECEKILEANLALLQENAPEFFKIYNIKDVAIQARSY